MTANLQTRQAVKVALNRALEVAAAARSNERVTLRVVAESLQAASDTRETVKERGHG